MIRRPPARLACVKHAASVRSEPGSNSQVHHARPGQGQATQMPIKGSAHHSRCVVRLRTHATDASPFRAAPEDDFESAHCFQKTDAIVKDHTLPDRRAARARRRADKGQPRIAAERKSLAKEPVPGGTGSRNLQPRGPSPPKARDDTKGTIGRTGRSNRSAAGGLTWRPVAPVSRPHSELPRRGPPRGGWAFRPQPQDPRCRRPPGRNHLSAGHHKRCLPTGLQGLEIQPPTAGTTLSGKAQNGAPRHPFQAPRTRPQRRNPSRGGGAYLAGPLPRFKSPAALWRGSETARIRLQGRAERAGL